MLLKNTKGFEAMKSNNIIELNGKLYDAKTGVPIETKAKAKKPLQKTVATISKKLPQRGRSIDGFSPRRNPVGTAHTATTKPIPPKAAEKQVAVEPKPTVDRAGVSTMKRAVKRSNTLNRSVVKAPTFAVSAPVVEASAVAVEEPVNSTALKHADSSRVSRVKNISKSSVISRFGAPSNQTNKEPSSANSLTAHLENTHTQPSVAPKPKEQLSTKERLIKKAIDSAIASNPVQAANNVTTAKKAHKKVKSHSQKSHKAGYATTALAGLLLAGYVAYLNVPSISMKVAAHRAGFAANLPSYQPAGYSLKGPIAYSPGQVTLNFASNTDQRKFTLKQQPTTWDSTALLENFVTKKSSNYLTYQDSGLTIYIIDGASAAWVNGGKLYHVEGRNSQLDTDQLLKLATSV